MASEQLPDDHYRISYEEIHLDIAETARQIRQTFAPDLMVAIGGGGFFPARVLRTFLKREGSNGKLVNVPIQAIGLSLYEDLGQAEKALQSSGPSSLGKIGVEVVRTQWLDAPKRDVKDGNAETQLHGGLLGKNILIVDEVDDSRTTLRYAYNELLSDVRKALEALTPEQRAQTPPTRFAIFVVHNKLRSKKGSLPIVCQRKDENGTVVSGVWYFAAETTGNIWIEYPWEQDDILEHNRLTALAKKLGQNGKRDSE
ncbi:PRTase-like protein [Meira miltonrushii]|uniref:PRTase-like protein n=1 Tax=Meira miltonrushii TaxID=1280837 RepID=A0A316VF79_9BASI|nr:PRTase-like protein [Meira miltonrushii]PWN36190.1 PRTase-like protein [Meira miltonrushii]